MLRAWSANPVPISQAITMNRKIDQALYSVDSVQSSLLENRYIADRALSTAVYLAGSLSKPLLLEGDPGVGKTELAQVLADVLQTRLIRLQCFEGIDSYSALYEWNYPKQLMDLKRHELQDESTSRLDIFTEDYLLKRPLLDAIQTAEDGLPPVLLIDEIDRADDEFEAFLLEVLSDFQISIPELGTVKATSRPLVILTSNGTRELHGALKRRCLYHWIDYPSPNRELAILEAQVPGINHRLATKVCHFVDQMREEDFYKKPGIAETIDWAQALIALGIVRLDADLVATTSGCLLKHKRDIDAFGNDRIDLLLTRLDDGEGRRENEP